MKIAVHGREAAPLAENEVRMRIDEDGFTKLMGTLAGLYVNPPEAVLREYTSNAFDSHAKAGVKRAILVSYPEPVWNEVRRDYQLEVEDFGLGMDVDDLTNIYSRYGASTKAGSNLEIGGFGIGAKSALSLGNTFFLRARKNGTEVNLTVTKGRDGVGVFTFATPTKTREPNGVRVRIPLSKGQRDAIHTAIIRGGFFAGAPRGGVEVNGKAISESVHDSSRYLPISSGREKVGWVRLRDDFKVASAGAPISYWEGRVTFLVGGVRFPVVKDMFSNVHLDGDAAWWERIERRLCGLLADGQSLYVNLPIGGIDIAPQRERIQITERSAEAVRAAFGSLFDLIPKAFSAAANKIDGRDAAFDFIAHNWRMFVSAKRSFPHRRLSDAKNSELVAYLSGGDFAWRGAAVANAVAMGGTVWHTVNGAYGVNIEHAQHAGGSIPTLLHFVDRGCAKHPNRRIVITAAHIDEANVKLVRMLLRTYGEARFGDSSIFAYLISAHDVPESLAATHHVVGIEAFEQAARQHRREVQAALPKVSAKPTTFPVLRNVKGALSFGRIEASEVGQAGAMHFAGIDARFKTSKYTAVRTFFSSLKDDADGRIQAGSHIMNSTPTDLSAYLRGADLIFIPKHGEKVVNKFFNPQRSLLWHVYRDAEQRLRALGPERFAGLMDAGIILASNYASRRSVLHAEHTHLLPHLSNLQSARLRYALEIMAMPSTHDLGFALVCGAIDWTRFRQQAAATGLNQELLGYLGDGGHARLYSWFNALQRIKPDNAAEIAFVLDALALRHGWA